MTENKCNCAVLIKNDFAICNSFLNQIKNCCIIIFISFAWGFSFKIYWIKRLLNANGGSNIKKIAKKRFFCSIWNTWNSARDNRFPPPIKCQQSKPFRNEIMYLFINFTQIIRSRDTSSFEGNSPLHSSTHSQTRLTHVRIRSSNVQEGAKRSSLFSTLIPDKMIINEIFTQSWSV